MGSMAAWRLARRGAKVVALEQFEPGHDRGSGHGESRIIRTAYFEGPDYVPLVREAFTLWRQLEAETGESLLTMTGGLMIGREDTALVRGVLRSVREHGLAHRILGANEVRQAYPQLGVRDDEIAVFEEAAGLLRPELAIRTAARRATELGAQILTGSPVEALDARGGLLRLRAGGGRLESRRGVVCAGAWSPTLLPGLRLPIRVQRKVLTWFEAEDPPLFATGRFPIFIWERQGLQWYGVPSLDSRTVKVSLHGGGQDAEPDTLDRAPRADDFEPISSVVAETIRGLRPEVARAEVCMYSLTPDEHFIVDRMPDAAGVVLLAGFSGHGFKFAPVLGEVAADLCLTGATERGIEGFRLDRLRLPA